MIKTWEQRQAESTEEWNEMPPPKSLFMAREIADLRKAVAKYEEMESTIPVDWDKYETDLAVKTLLADTSPENKAFYDKIDQDVLFESQYMSYLEAGGPGDPMSYEEWRAKQ